MTTFNGLQVPDRSGVATIGAGEVLSGRPDRAAFTAGGESIQDRSFSANVNSFAVSGVVAVTTFEALKSETITRIRTFSGSTAAGATPTMCKVGVYSVADNGDLTKLAETANNTGLWAATHTAYTENLLTSFEKVAGRRYAVAMVIVTAATIPTHMTGMNVAVVSAGYDSGMIGELPKLAGRVSGQTDLPATIANASVAATPFGSFHALLLP